MAIRGYMESSLASSEIYQGLNQSGEAGSGKSVTERAKDLVRNAQILTNEDIESAYISVRQISDTLTREAIKAFDSGRVVLVYNSDPSISVTPALPFITFNTKAGYKTYVFVKPYIKITRDNVMSMQAPILRDLLTGAMIANGLKINYTNLATNQYLQKVLCEIYSKLVMRILNREFSVVVDRVLNDTLYYWIARFFLMNIYGSNETAENIETLSTAHFKKIDELGYQDIKRQYDESSPTKFSELLNLLKTASPRMKTLNMATFMSDWLNYYYYPGLLAMDNIEYLIFMAITLLSGNNLISIAASDIVKEAKNIKSFRGELLKLI